MASISPNASPEPGPPAVRAPGLGEYLLVFFLGAALMAWVYGGWRRADDGIPGNDSFYHIKMATMMPQAATLRQFPWLRFCYFTDDGDAFVSHHYGFHILLSPFVRLSNWLTGSYLPGGRWGVCVFFGFLAVVIHAFTAGATVQWRWVWMSLFVLLPFQFFTRHAFVRAITASLLLMLLSLWFAFRRRYVLLALTIAVYIHVYMGGVLFAPLIVAAYVVSLSLCGGSNRTAVKVAGWSLAGWCVGILSHPYREGMWDFLRLQVLGSGLSPDISVGKEWRPYNDVWWFVQMCGVMLGAWIAAIAVRLRSGPRINAQEVALLLLNVGFFVLTAKARRFIEYWPAFCLLSTLYLVRGVLERSTRRLAMSSDTLTPAPLPGRERGLWDRLFTPPRIAAASIAVILAVAGFTPQWREISEGAACKFDLPAIRSAMDFLKEHSSPGEVVFTDDWDVFPVFFYYNSHNHYVVGLDPKFTHARHPDLWERYMKITRGQTPAQAEVTMPDGAVVQVHSRLEDIRDHFAARWVVTDRDHKPLARSLAAATDFAELVYPATAYAEAQDAPYLVFRVR